MAQAPRRIVWTAPALDELDEIAAYIARDDPNAASELVERCLTATDRLLLFPEAGRHLPERVDKRYRELIVSPCRTIYRREGQRMVIVHILRGERSLRRRYLR